MTEAAKRGQDAYILLVEDDPAISFALESLFTIKNYAFTTEGEEKFLYLQPRPHGQDESLSLVKFECPG